MLRLRGEEALDGLSLKDAAWPSEAECDGASTSPTLDLLKTRPVQVSSSFEPAVTTTTPFCLLSMGVGSDETGATTTKKAGLAGAEVPALRRVTSLASLFLLLECMALN